MFVNERGQPAHGNWPNDREGWRGCQTAFPGPCPHARHSTGFALAAKGMDTRRLQHYLGHASITNTVGYTAMSPEPFKDLWR